VASSSDPKRLGRYEIVELLAQGGMAELFLARLPGIEGFAKHVVVKRVLPNLARDREFIQMFIEEARLAATLHHQNIVQVHDIGHDDDGYFFAMEYLHGVDVGEILREREIPLEIALEIVRASCAGLHYAHERKTSAGAPQGIVHRDVSPQNLFVTFEGGIKLLDFGIAKAVQQIASPYTRSGTLRGKLPYMSPEQCNAERIDRRSDIFSLAVVLWEMTVGKRLYGADRQGDFEVLKSIVEQDAPTPSSRRPDYPPALEAIVMKGLRRDRNARHQTCDELQAELEGFMRATNRWVTARDVGAWVRAQFADRAASSLRLPAMVDEPRGGDLVMFPRTEPLASRPATVPDRPSRPSNPPVSVAPDPGPEPVGASGGSRVIDPVAAVPAQTTDGGSGPVMLPVRRSNELAAAADPRARPSSIPPTPRSWPPSIPPPIAAQPSGPTAEPPRGSRTIAIVVVSVIATALVMGLGVYIGSRGDGDKSAAAPAPGSAAPGDARPKLEKPEEDELWFAPDDYFVSETPYRGGRLERILVAKRLGPARFGKTQFLTSSGAKLETQFFWTTHLATDEEFTLGRIAFCKAALFATSAPAPISREGARTGQWIMGPITDIAEAGDGAVMVADCRCEVAGVRVVDDP
jgi:serine/threonine-protein kinase